MTHHESFALTRALAEKILLSPLGFEWSLQGMGMLRLYLPGNMRLHVWDSRYRVPGVSMIHDHLQWGLASTIVAGHLTNNRYEFTEVGGKPYMFATLKPGYGCHFKHDPVAVRLVERDRYSYIPGGSYAQMPAEIHSTEALDGTVTIMRKTPTGDDSARVFWPAGEEWGSAEPRAATTDEVIDITSNALARWFGGAS